MATVQTVRGWQPQSESRCGADGSTEVWVYRVAFDGPASGYQARTSQDPVTGLRVPQRGELMEAGPGINVFVQEVSARPVDDGGFAWDVVVSGGVGNTSKMDPKDADKSPLEKEADVAWTTERSTEPAEKDLDGKWLCSSAGDPFQGITINRRVRVCTITKTVESYDDDAYAPLIDCVNSAAFMGKAVGTVLVQDIVPRTSYYADKTLTDLTVVLHYKPGGWHLILVDQGPHYKDVGGNIHSVNDADGLVGGMRLLDTDGTFLAPGATPKTKDFRMIESADFGPLAALLALAT